MKKFAISLMLVFSFLVTGCTLNNVKSVEKIEKIKTVGLTDYYTIFYSDGTYYEFTIDNGKNGVDGLPGKDGIDGLPGKDGITPTIEVGSNGNWIINGVDTNIPVKAEPIIPTIGANGNWFIGDKDTGFSSKGEDGKTPSITINSDGYWVINGSVTNFKANGNIDDITTKLDYLFDVVDGEFITEYETLKNPTYSYVTSTFSGWTGVIGRPEKVSTISFRVRARSNPIKSIKCYLNVGDKNGECIETRLLDVDIRSYEQKDIYFTLSDTYDNYNKDMLYFGYACDSLCDVYSNFTSESTLPENEGIAIQAYITNGNQPKSLSNFTDVYGKPSRYLYVRLGKIVPVYVPNKNFVDSIREKVEVNLADQYYLTPGDNFQLFYRGVIKAINPYNYYIRIKTKYGSTFPRYYEWTPSLEQIGTYDFCIEVLDNNFNLLGTDKTKLIVSNASMEHEKTNILCFGDSLTASGDWVYEGYRRFAEVGGNPNGLGLNYINMVGSKTKNNIKYEGYGGWTWETYLSERSPFYNQNTKKIDFIDYAKKINVDKIDYFYILLTWNGHNSINTDFDLNSRHFKFAKQLINQIHSDFARAKIRLLGLQMPSQNGGMGTNYGTSYPYSDAYGMLCTAFNYNKTLEELSNLKEYNGFIDYIDIAGQFDTDYNMPVINKPVNNRNDKNEIIGSNGVHPTYNGYMQIGDAFFRSLVYEFKTN